MSSSRRFDSMVKIVGSGIDTLVMGFCIDRYEIEAEFEKLVDAKTKAGDKLFSGKGSPVEFFGSEFMVSARGAKGYEWVLQNADIRVCIARKALGGRVYPEVYATFTQENLWSKGASAAVEAFKLWLNRFAVVVDDKVSRVDLCIDLEMPLPDIDINNEIVTRAKCKQEFSLPQDIVKYFYGRRITDYRIGSGDLIGRFYDKTLEIKVKQKEWFRDYWLTHGWDGITPVSRCEFQLRRNLLREYEINSFEDLLERIADIWRYCTNDWLRVCDCGSASNQARWQPKDFWRVIQYNYSAFGQALGVLRNKTKRVRYEHLIKQVRGCLITAGALVAAGKSESEAMYKLRQELKSMLKSYEFKQDIVIRRALVGNMEKPDRHLVDAAIRLGAVPLDVEF